jgi:class 3 adenylate cyclase/tetratricopeptide (TPR) repeat protein
MKERRQLAAIMFTDVVGYSALMSKDENRAMEILGKNRERHKSAIAKFNGEYIKEIGDGTLAIFPSAWDAVNCALELQNTVIKEDTYRLRIGIHIGDVVAEENDVFGDAVNIAARIQGICDPGKVFISGRILEDVKNKLETEASYLGEKLLKNIDHPVEIYAISATEKKLSTFDHRQRTSGKKEHFIYTKRSRLNRITKGVLFLLAGLILTALMILLFRPTLLNAFTKGGSTPIAVISFENQTGDSSFNFLQKAIPNLLITNLEQSRLFQVITWDRMKDVMAQLGKKDVEIIDASLGFEICSKEGCQVIVTGSFVRAGDVFVTDVKVLDVASKKILKSASSKGSGVGSILDTQIDELSKAIARAAGISALKVETAPMRIQDVTTTSMEVYDYYLKGLDQWSNANWEDGRRFFEKAVKIDPGFAMAYFYLHGCYDGLQNYQKSRETLEKAYQASSRATENEQLLIGAWYNGQILGDKQKQLDLLLELVEKAPKDKGAHFILGYWYGVNHRRDDAMREFMKVLELDPDYGAALNQLGYIFYIKGDMAKAMEYLERYASLSPNDANPFDSMGDLYYFRDQFDEALVKYKKAWEIKPGFTYTAEKIAYTYARMEDYPKADQWMKNALKEVLSESTKAYIYLTIALMDYHFGKLDHALQSLHQYIVTGTSQDLPHVRSDSVWLMAWIQFDLGHYEDAERSNLAAVQGAPDDTSSHERKAYYKEYYFLGGLIHIREKRMDSALMNIDRVKSYATNLARDFEYHYLLREFRIASVQRLADLDNIPPDTVRPLVNYEFPEYLTASMPFQRNSLAETYRKYGLTDKAIAEYERLITHIPGSKDRRLVNPRYHYYLGILYQEKGMKTKAAEQFRTFLDLWQDADPGFPEPADAKKRIGQLLK